VVIVVQFLCFTTFGAATTSIDEVLSDEGIGLNMLMGLVQIYFVSIVAAGPAVRHGVQARRALRHGGLPRRRRHR
jgi:hypothetical protein